MPLNELGNSLGGHAAVIGSLRIDEQDRPSATDAQATDLRPVARIRAGCQRKIFLFQFSLEHFPRRLADPRGCARFPGAQENMPRIMADQQFLGQLREWLQFFVHGRTPRSNRNRRTISAKTSTLAVAPAIASQSIAPSGSTSNKVPPN